MRVLEIKLRNRVILGKINEAIKETGVEFLYGLTILTYRDTCELARIATDGEHEFEPFIDHFLKDVVEMWENWNAPNGYEIAYWHNYHYMKFID